MYLLVINQLLTMMIIVLGALLFAKIVGVSENQQKFLSKLLLYFINPCLVVSSFNKEFSKEKLFQFLIVFVISIVVHFVMILVAIAFTKNKKSTHKDLDVLDRLGICFTNCGFIGIPLIRGVFGEEGVFLLMGFLVTFNLYVWTYGYYQVSGSINLKKIITNPNIIGVLIGFIIFCMPFTLPEFIAKPISMIGDLNTATSMILLGILFASFKKPESSQIIFRVLKVSFIRLVFMSFIMIALLTGINFLFKDYLEIRTMLFVILICSMCPSATSIPSLACVYEKDTSYASLIVSITSILCMLTVPSFVALAENFIK